MASVFVATPRSAYAASPLGTQSVNTQHKGEHTSPPVLVLLTNAIQWNQINATDTPSLAQWAASGTMFNLVPPIVSGWGCPIDVALAMGAGQQVANESVSAFPTCSIRPIRGGWKLPGWGAIARSDDVHTTLAQTGHFLGAFGDVIAGEGVSTRVIGSEAAALLVDSEGTVPENYTSAPAPNADLASEIATSVHDHELTVASVSAANFELDPERNAAASSPLSLLLPSDVTSEYERDQQIVLPESYRVFQAQRAVRRLDTVLESVPQGTKVYVLSLQSLSSSDVMQPGFVSFGGKTPASAGGFTAPNQIHGASSSRDASAGGDASQGGSGALADMLGSGGLAWSTQVRQPGTVSYQSVVPSVLADLGISLSTIGSAAAQSFANVPMHIAEGTITSADTNAEYSQCHPTGICFTERVDHLESNAQKAAAVRALRGKYIRNLTWIVIAFTLSATLMLYGAVRPSRRTRLPKRLERIAEGNVWRTAGRWLRYPSKALSITTVRCTVAYMGLWVSAIPLGTFVSTWLYHWWEKPNPGSALYTSIAAISAVMAVIALVSARIHVFAPLCLLGSATAIAILGDVVGGSRVLADSPIGFNTLLGARFYGLGNEAFALEATGLILGLGGLGALLIRLRMKRVLVSLLIMLIGAIAIAIGVWPTLGADFGGAIALLPAVVLLAALMSGIRMSMRRLAVVVAGGVVLALAAAILDWLRGPQARTHLGGFVQSVIDGEALEVIVRKLSVNLRLLVTSSHRWIVLAGIIFLAVVVWAWLCARCVGVLTALAGESLAKRQRGVANTQLDHAAIVEQFGNGADQQSLAARSRRSCAAPTSKRLRKIAYSPIGATLLSVVVCLGIAFAVNDSGIALPGMGFILLIPGLAATVLLDLGESHTLWCRIKANTTVSTHALE
ncbi:MAG: hypothetical protein PUK40_03960 [Actinomycetaceae bacterium]|nr:hypothetical protein [Arcanobacterium sp.]MDD7505093.1 hypothetical protein [Actinomycetaceae bacterium]MDY6142610.1 hypothetical protein [Arcanobacterium sp.]